MKYPSSKKISVFYYAWKLKKHTWRQWPARKDLQGRSSCRRVRRWALVSCPVCPAPAPRTPAQQPTSQREFNSKNNVEHWKPDFFIMFRRKGACCQFIIYYARREQTVQTRNPCGEVRTRDESGFTWWQTQIIWQPAWSQVGPTGQLMYTSFGVLASHPPSPR